MDFFDGNGLVIHYKWIDNKKEKTFLLINSLGTDYRIWDKVIEQLQENGNVLLFDKRGHGLSDTTTETKGLEDYAEDVWLLMNHLEIKSCFVIGLSVGGIIAQLLVHHHPEIIEKLILCDTCHRIGFTDFWNTRIQQIKSHGLKSISEDVLKRWFPPFFHIAHPAIVQGCKNMLERCDLKGYIKTCEGIRDADTREIVRQIKKPVLCIVGSEDKSTTAEEVKALADLIEGSVFKVIPGSGHIPCVDNPTVLSKLIIDFIK